LLRGAVIIMPVSLKVKLLSESYFVGFVPSAASYPIVLKRKTAVVMMAAKFTQQRSDPQQLLIALKKWNLVPTIIKP